MRIIVLSLILFCCGTCPITAQSDYIVTTPSTQEIPVGEEEQFIKNNFPLQPLCKWTPGMKFMFVPSTRNMFLPTKTWHDRLIKVPIYREPLIKRVAFLLYFVN